MIPIIRRAQHLDAEMSSEDLDLPQGNDTAEESLAAVLPLWEEELRCRPERPSLSMVLLRYLWRNIAASLCYGAMEAVGPFASVILMQLLSDFIRSAKERNPDPMWQGGIMVLGFFIIQVLASTASAQSMRMVGHQEMRLEGALRLLLVRKVMSISVTGLRQAGGPGALMQNFTTDTSQVSTNLPILRRSSEQVLSLVGGLIYLGFIAGWPAVSALVVMCLFIPVNQHLATSFMQCSLQKLRAGDKRASKVIELLNAARVIKFYAWEDPFAEAVKRLRRPELEVLGKLIYQLALMFTSFAVATPIMQVLLFLLMVYATSSPSTLKFFQALSVISILNSALLRAPFVYSAYLQADSSLRRISTTLLAHDRHREAEKYALDDSDHCAVGDVVIQGASFSWPMDVSDKVPTRDGTSQSASVNEPIHSGATSANPMKAPPERLLAIPAFEARAGELVVVVGKVGSGKSSLLSAVLSEMARESGTLMRRGSVAYVPQTPWILNGTIRNNVIVHLPYDAERYRSVLESVDLFVDFSALPNGDLTEVGEKGINLSGGQKQRISIARALYQEAEIYVFDDPLSALDAHVGRHVFDRAIVGTLRRTTRILVTHQLQYLQHATRVYLVQNMTVVETAIPETVPTEPVEGESEIHGLLRAFQKTTLQSSPCTSPSTVKKPEPQVSPSPTGGALGKESEFSRGLLTAREERQSGAVKSQTALTYFGCFGSGIFWPAFVLIQVLIASCNLFSQLWMGWWIGSRWPALTKKYSSGFFLGIFTAAALAAALLTFLRQLLWRRGAVKPPRILGERMTHAVLHAPMSFFDTTPIGRIVNRFTRDVSQLDMQLQLAASQFLNYVFAILGSVAGICYAVPYSTPAFALWAAGVIVLQPTTAMVILRRLSSAANGPVAALFSETLHGTVSIRALGIQNFCLHRFALYVDERNSSSFFDRMAFESVRCWVSVVMALVASIVALVIVLSRQHLVPTLALFALTNSTAISMSLGNAMIHRGNMMMSLNSVERVMEYCDLAPEPSGEATPPPGWPSEGRVEFHRVSAQYRPGLPFALNELSFTIRPGEKVGVVGRTGSGKSSLLLCVFRLIPLLGDSRISIDDVDTATIPLQALRSRVAAIPQEPVIFAGSVRDNLDPFQTSSDEELIAALAACGLEEPLSQLVSKQSVKQALPDAKRPEALGKKEADPSAAASRSNLLAVRLGDGDLSAGQKQLLCLARAMARRVRIVVLDEATSSVDVHTDALIQQAIRTAFRDSTIITVAHRLNTIMDSDRILVLDHGQLAEFDTPAALMLNSSSLFSQLAAEANDSFK